MAEPAQTLTDERDPARHPAVAPQRRPWSVLILLSVAEFMVILDATVVNVAPGSRPA